MRPQRAKAFMQLVANLGPAYIKAGQALSSRPDLLPPEYLQELQKLQDRLPPFSNEEAFALIESELGLPLNEAFDRLEPEPVAAASIGQVYKAYLKTGEPVAIKVQRPNCAEIIAMDIYILRNLSGRLNDLFRVIRKDFDLKLIVDEFGKLIFDEIDYLNEARNAERFRELYGNIEDIVVPKVYWKYTTNKVLTMEWIDGTRLESMPAIDERSRLVRALVQCSLRQMLENGYFHADPHGGNLLATSNGALCYLDFGMMSTLTRDQSYGIILAIVNLVNRDWTSLVRLYKRLGLLNQNEDEQPIVDAFSKALPDVLGASVGEFNFTSVIKELGSIFYSFDFQLPPYYTAILRCLGVLEGVAIQVDPNFKILNEAYPFVASRLLVDDSEELRTALEIFLTSTDGALVPGRWTSLLSSASRLNGEDVGVALKSFLDYMLSDSAVNIRYGLADLLVDELDELGVDFARYATGLFSTRFSISLPFGSKEPVQTEKLQMMFQYVEKALKRDGVHVDNLGLIFAEFLARPEGQKFAAEVTFGVIERYTSRSIRTLFRLPPPETNRSSGTLATGRPRKYVLRRNLDTKL
eukprot:Plantae.Rhodophyta-Purpureofilum_apyrenoidigerum.ctg21786.p1 GENE.Plantae.Rhodophyta-Purpureofilum_apyrenoidigerum.ctg21786~~Plantae.Rhodophyta-Purpureofilum_apyrenoidigerum.ctg21786.p1  ORF type:complete len:618 (+),score=137.39 Plantae.Rhodophyta-Purpureofilum_apyrenoidigerum.ctg21786:113-1855(+)